MKLEIVAEHSILADTPTGYVLDVGARSFSFSKAMANRWHQVIALDPDPTIEDPKHARIKYRREALRDSDGLALFEMAADPQARRLSSSGSIPVVCKTIEDVMREEWVGHFRIVKLDCEGAEYGILENWPGSIADQVTVEFHEHVAPQSSERYENIISHMSQWYELVQHEKTLRHCIGTPNYWDSLWVLK